MGNDISTANQSEEREEDFRIDSISKGGAHPFATL